MGVQEFTIDDIADTINRLATLDGRAIPKLRNSNIERSGKCIRCGSKSYPYTLCRKHREHGTIKRVLDKLVNSGTLERVKDGRGLKSGATYRNKNHLKKATPFVREIKIGRNENCPCGSMKKFKRCCMNISGR